MTFVFLLLIDIGGLSSTGFNIIHGIMLYNANFQFAVTVKHSCLVFHSCVHIVIWFGYHLLSFISVSEMPLLCCSISNVFFLQQDTWLISLFWLNSTGSVDQDFCQVADVRKLIIVQRVNWCDTGKRVAAVLLVTGHVAAAAYQISLAHTGYYLYFTMGWEMPPKLPLPWGFQTPTYCVVPWAQTASRLVPLF